VSGAGAPDCRLEGAARAERLRAARAEVLHAVGDVRELDGGPAARAFVVAEPLPASELRGDGCGCGCGGAAVACDVDLEADDAFDSAAPSGIPSRRRLP
jgi:hypothetical protein